MIPRTLMTLAACAAPTLALAQGSVPVRVEDPSGSHCINAETEDITIHVRRVITQKTVGLFTEDNRAGVIVSAKLRGAGAASSDVSVQVPSMTLVTIRDEQRGRISLPLEYQIASYLALSQNDVLTTDIQLSIALARTRGRTTFGEVLDLAGNALNSVPIPRNPFANAADKFLAFANNAVNTSINRGQTVPFAEVSMAFNRGTESDLSRCRSAGKERTGAIAVLRSVGLGGELVPVVNTEQLYCFRYSSTSTYELLAAKRVQGTCPDRADAFQGVNNDYVMFLISAQARPDTSVTVAMAGDRDRQIAESRARCQAFALAPVACGIKQ